MIQIKPNIDYRTMCPKCNSVNVKLGHIIFQGPHICAEFQCMECKNTYLQNLPVGQGILKTLTVRKSDSKFFGQYKDIAWFADPIINVYLNPKLDNVKLDVIKNNNSEVKKVIILNTLDNCYGHSLLHFLNLQNIINKKKDFRVIVIIQPFLKWLLPKEGIDEVWVAHVSFDMMRHYYKDLNDKIQTEFQRFDEVYFSSAHLCPTNIDIEKFTKIKPYNFDQKSKKPRITFVWREDVNRFWIKSYWIYGVLRKMKIAKILLPLHYLRVLIFLLFLHNKIKGKGYQISLAGLGNFGWFPAFVDDKRITSFDKQTEIDTCTIYAQSELVIGVHGSSMILPSAHAGMTINIMPLKRWGNFIEDILYSENEDRLASFQKRVIPMNTTIFETCDITTNMLFGRSYFIKKFLYNQEEL